MIKEGWADGYATIADDVMTLSFASGTDAYSPDVSLKNGTKYLIKMDIKSNADTETGCWVYADTSRVTADQSWDIIFAGATVDGTATIDSGIISKIGSTWSTVSLVYTPAKDILCLRFTDWNKKGLQIKNFTISEVVNTKTFNGSIK